MDQTRRQSKTSRSLAKRLAPVDKRSPHASLQPNGGKARSSVQGGPAQLPRHTTGEPGQSRPPSPAGGGRTAEEAAAHAGPRNGGESGGRRTLRGLQAPSQNGGHLWQGLFSLPPPNDRLGDNPAAHLNPSF